MLVRRKKIYRKREFLPGVAVKVSGISWITNKRVPVKRNTRHSGFFKTAFASTLLTEGVEKSWQQMRR